MQTQPQLSPLAQARHDRVMAALQALPVLPTAINVPMRILKMSRDPNAPGLEDFARIILPDAAVSGKLLELANSAWFAPPRPVTRVSDAVRMIGLKNLLPLLFGLSLSAVFNRAGIPEEQRGQLWYTSIHRAVIARQWARSEKLECTEEAFLAGVIQDMALPVMLAADPATAMELTSILALPDEQRRQREVELYGVDHGEFGARIARNMKLPELFVQATRSHHAPDGPDLPAEFGVLAPGLKLAAAFPHGGARLDDVAARRLQTCLGDPALKGIAGRFEAFIREVNTEIKSLGTLVGSSQETGAGIEEFLNGVADRIARSMFDAIGESASMIDKLRAAEDELQQRIVDLETQVVQADYDDLSGVLKRRAFLDRGEKVLNMARTYQMGAAVGFADMDNFKGINDRYGHEIGDRAIAHFAKAMRDLVGNRGVAGRCGGDEFLFIIIYPRTSTLTQIENEIVPALNNLEMQIGTQQINVCASIGLVWLGIPGPTDTIQHAIQRADDLMYQAKRSGKSKPILPHQPDAPTRLAS